MGRYEVRTPHVGFTGESAGVAFQDGAAVVTSDTQAGFNALTYFRQAGYGILALDDAAPIDEVLHRGNESAVEESARLDREIADLEARRDLDAKRKKRDELYAEVFGEDAAAARGAEEPDSAAAYTLPTGMGPNFAQPAIDDPDGPAAPAADPQQGEGSTAEAELLAPPANNASAEDWRAWAVASGRASQEDVATKSRTELQNTLGADYDRDREAQLKGGAA